MQDRHSETYQIGSDLLYNLEKTFNLSNVLEAVLLSNWTLF